MFLNFSIQQRLYKSEKILFKCFCDSFFKLFLECLTVTGTKAKMLIVTHILDKLMKMDVDDALTSVLNSSLLHDAARDVGMLNLIFYNYFPLQETNNKMNMTILVKSRYS